MNGVTYVAGAVILTMSVTMLLAFADLVRQFVRLHRRAQAGTAVEVDWRRVDAPAEQPAAAEVPDPAPQPRQVSPQVAAAAYAAQSHRPGHAPARRHPHAQYWEYANVANYA